MSEDIKNAFCLASKQEGANILSSLLKPLSGLPVNVVSGKNSFHIEPQYLIKDETDINRTRGASSIHRELFVTQKKYANNDIVAIRRGINPLDYSTHIYNESLPYTEENELDCHDPFASAGGIDVIDQASLTFSHNSIENAECWVHSPFSKLVGENQLGLGEKIVVVGFETEASFNQSLAMSKINHIGRFYDFPETIKRRYTIKSNVEEGLSTSDTGELETPLYDIVEFISCPVKCGGKSHQLSKHRMAERALTLDIITRYNPASFHLLEMLRKENPSCRIEHKHIGTLDDVDFSKEETYKYFTDMSCIYGPYFMLEYVGRGFHSILAVSLAYSYNLIPTRRIETPIPRSRLNAPLQTANGCCHHSLVLEEVNMKAKVVAEERKKAAEEAKTNLLLEDLVIGGVVSMQALAIRLRLIKSGVYSVQGYTQEQVLESFKSGIAKRGISFGKVNKLSKKGY